MNDEVDLPKGRFANNPLVRGMQGLMNGIFDLLFLPPPKEEEPEYKEIRVAVLCASLLLILLGVLAFPPLLKHLLRQPLDPAFVSHHKATFKVWLDYVRILLEITFAVCVSGSVFAEAVKTNIRSNLKSFYRERVTRFNGLITLEREIAQQTFRDWVAEVERLAQPHATLKHFFKSMLLGVRYNYRLVQRFNRILTNLWVRLLWFAIWSNVGRFPFGLFGIISYFLFVLITCDKILKLYVDAVSG
jgi:hypothetical protein